MNFQEAVATLAQNGYTYYGRRMLSGYDFDSPDGEQVYYTEEEVISLAERLSQS